MRRGSLLITWAVVATSAAAQSTNGVAMVNATVVDVERGVLVPGQTILTSGGRIERVGPASTRIPAGRTRVDLRGAFVIPGLWDMHVHITGSGAAPADIVGYFGSLFLANGVTGVRDAGGSAPVLAALDAASRNATGTMPRLVHAGEKIAIHGAGAPAAARFADTLRVRVAAGATYGKLHQDFPADETRAALGACARQQLKCVAHIPPGDTAIWLNAPGRGSFEHLFNLIEQVSSVPSAQLFAERHEYHAPTIRQRILYKLRLRTRPQDPDDRRLAVRDTTRDAEFFTRFAQSGSWLTPTLVLHQFITGGAQLPAPASDSSLSLRVAPVSNRTADQQAIAQRKYQMYAGLVKSLSSGGVPLLAGTDFAGTHVPGAILHGELALLQDAGVPAADVLRMATLNVARYQDAADSLGTIGAGRVADLVVLRRNPLDDIRNVGEVEMVMTRGHLMRRAALDSLIAKARDARPRVQAAIANRSAPR